MVQLGVLILGCIVAGVVRGQMTSSCQDLDTSACVLFSKAKPDLCQDEAFSMSTCKRFCGNCPLECYSCPTPVFGPNDCNVTTTCGSTQTCMWKHLAAKDGHHEYIMTCEEKSICDGSSLGFGFGALIGKRALMFDEESPDDVEEHDRERRDVSISCCDSDFCNVPMTTTTNPPTSPGPFPHGCNRDIVILVDDSGSVGYTNFAHAVDFINSMISELNIGPNAAQVSVVPFSSRVQTGWYLNTYADKASMLQGLTKVRFQSGTTQTDDALHIVRTQVLTSAKGDRPGAKNVVVVLTDGRSNDKQGTINQANLLHTVSDDVISIVIGSSVDANEIQAIATDSHHIFDVRAYTNLQSILSQVMQVVCNSGATTV